MLFIAYAILPFAADAPADAIRASLARFQMGLRGDVPARWIAFHDETEYLLRAHRAHLDLPQRDT